MLIYLKSTQNFRINILIILMIFSIIGCQKKGELEQELIDFSINCNQKCEFKFESFTPFNWDYFYYFSAGLSPTEVNTILKKEINFKDSYGSIVVFIKGNKIVHYEQWEGGIEEFLENQIVITDINAKYKQFEKGQRFIMNKEGKLIIIRPTDSMGI